MLDFKNFCYIIGDMDEKLLLLKIKLTLAKMKINESYRASNYLAEIILNMTTSGDDSKSGYLSAVDVVGEKFKVAHSSIVLGVSNLLRDSELAQDEKFCCLNIYRKIRYVKDYILKAM